MGYYDDIDLGMTLDGDIFVTAGDIGVVRDTATININNVPTRKALASALKVDILKRLATDPEDYLEAEILSANLQRFKGKKVTEYLVSQMEEAIERALTIDGRVDPADLEVVCLPVDKKSIIAFIFVTVEGERLNLTPGLLFEMNDGIVLA